MLNAEIKEESFSKKLREIRRRKNLSQAEMGKILGLHYTHISRYERGVSKPTVESLKRIAEALEVTTDYLIEDKPDKAAKAKIEDRMLLEQFHEIEKLSEEDKYIVKELLDAFLAKRKIQQIIKT